MTLPQLNLDDKRFDDFVKEAISKIPIYSPKWTDHNKHDPGITIIELLAWLSEMQLYFLNRVTKKSYVKFFKLLGIPGVKSSLPAKVYLSFNQNESDNVSIPPGVEIGTELPGTNENIIFQTLFSLNIVNSNLTAVLNRVNNEFKDNTYFNNGNKQYYPFGIEPIKDSEIYLGFNNKLPLTEITLFIFTEKRYEDQNGSDDSGYEKPQIFSTVILKWEFLLGNDWTDENNWKEINLNIDETDNLMKEGRITFTIDDEMIKSAINNYDCYWLRCKVDTPGFHIPPSFKHIAINTVKAEQSVSINNIIFSSTGLQDFVIKLDHKNIKDGSNIVKINYKDNWEEWTPVDDFDSSKPDDKHYLIDNINGMIFFGDGINGYIPKKGYHNIKVSYKYTMGKSGNVKSNKINNLLTELPYNIKINNMEDAFGGKDYETFDYALYRLKQKVRKISRAVTTDDYEYLILNAHELNIARVKVIPRYHKRMHCEIPKTLTIIIVPDSPLDNPNPDKQLIKTVYNYLERFRMLNTEIFIIPPEYIEVKVSAEVVCKDEYLPEPIIENINTRLSEFLHPLTGGEDNNGWPFGKSLYISEIYELIDNIEGVDYVVNVCLYKNENEKFIIQDKKITISKHALIFSAAHDIKISK